MKIEDVNSSRTHVRLEESSSKKETGWYNRFCKDHTCVEEIRGSPPCLLLMKKYYTNRKTGKLEWTVKI